MHNTASITEAMANTNIDTSVTGTETVASVPVPVAPVVISKSALDFIAEEKEMVLTTKRTSAHHNVSKIWHLELAKDADLTREVRAKFIKKCKFEIQFIE